LYAAFSCGVIEKDKADLAKAIAAGIVDPKVGWDEALGNGILITSLKHHIRQEFMDQIQNKGV